VISAKNRRKKGKAAPAAMAEREPKRSLSLYEGVVYLKREKKGAGGIFFSSTGS
jgi:hypothetical protein